MTGPAIAGGLASAISKENDASPFLPVIFTVCVPGSTRSRMNWPSCRSAGRLIVDGHLALIEIRENAEALRLRLQRETDRDRLTGIHCNAARGRLVAVQERGDLVVAGRQAQRCSRRCTAFRR